MTTSPSEIIATETGPIKAATILAALRAAGWEVVRANPDSMDEILNRQAAVDRLRPAKRKYIVTPVRLPHWFW